MATRQVINYEPLEKSPALTVSKDNTDRRVVHAVAVCVGVYFKRKHELDVRWAPRNDPSNLHFMTIEFEQLPLCSYTLMDNIAGEAGDALRDIIYTTYGAGGSGGGTGGSGGSGELVTLRVELWRACVPSAERRALSVAPPPRGATRPYTERDVRTALELMRHFDRNDTRAVRALVERVINMEPNMPEPSFGYVSSASTPTSDSGGTPPTAPYEFVFTNVPHIRFSFVRSLLDISGAAGRVENVVFRYVDTATTADGGSNGPHRLVGQLFVSFRRHSTAQRFVAAELPPTATSTSSSAVRRSEPYRTY
jgi:hypothetical protein